MMWYIVAFIIIVLTILILLGNRPLYHRNIDWDKLEYFVNSFVLDNAEGSILFIDDENSPKFVQFLRLQNVLLFGFPEAPWSTQYFETLLDRIKELNFKYAITDGKGSVVRFLEVDIGLDDRAKAVSNAVRIARTAFGIMGLDKNSKFKIHCIGDLRRDDIRARLESQRKKIKESRGTFLNN